MAAAKLVLLESRVTTLETEVAHLRARAAQNGTPSEDWVDQMYGLFADYPDFDEVVELGRKYRESLRPKPAKKKVTKAVKKNNR